VRNIKRNTVYEPFKFKAPKFDKSNQLLHAVLGSFVLFNNPRLFLSGKENLFY
jgi:hypothetical protein